MQETKPIADMTIGEIVAQDYRTAEVFEKHGIDFCCGGNVTLAEIASSKGVELDQITREIAEATSAPVSRSENYSSWSPSFLTDYIINNHHSYLKENTGQIAAYAHKIAEVHGANHPELQEIAAIFDKVAADVAEHLREEEEVFFPAVQRLEAAGKTEGSVDENDLEALRCSLARLGSDHEELGDAVHKIRELSIGFTIPPDACNTYVVTYQKLKEFEDDIHKHVHLENNILFPKAAQL